MAASLTNQPVETVQHIYEAFARGDLDAVMSHCADDATIAQDPALPWGGRYVGRAGIAEFATRLTSAVDTAVVSDVIFQAGDRVVQLGRSRGTVRRNGTAYDVAECHVWTFRDGIVTGVEFYIDSAKILPMLGS